MTGGTAEGVRVVELPEDDEARLGSIERGLRAQDPGLARRLDRHRRPRWRWSVAGALAVVLLTAGTVLVPAGVALWAVVVILALLGVTVSVLAGIALYALLTQLRGGGRDIGQDPTAEGPHTPD